MLNRLAHALIVMGFAALVCAAGGDAAAEEGGGEIKASTRIAVEANSGFAIDLYRQLVEENEGKNLFFSPYSVSVALNMVAEGARGETAEQMGTVLGFPKSVRNSGEDAKLLPWNNSMIHSGIRELNGLFNRDENAQNQLVADIGLLKEALAGLKAEMATARKAKNWKLYSKVAAKQRDISKQIESLTKQQDTYELRTANALWAEKTYPFNRKYLDTIDRFYSRGGIRPVDFKGNFEKIRLEINDWAEQQTNDRIKDLMPEGSLDANTRLVLANAIYFKGDWIEPFDEKGTKPSPFTTADGKTAEVPLMQKRGPMSAARYGAFNGDGSFFNTPARTSPGDKTRKYPVDGGFTVVELPYQGEDLSMLVLLPTEAEGLSLLEKKLSVDMLDAVTAALKKRDVNVLLPKFKAETEYALNDTLKSLGMTRVFTSPADPAGGAQLDGMSDATSSANKLFISLVQHKAFVEVNEKGTEAAAATGISIGVTSIPRDVPFIPTLKADHPFIYMIRDVRSGSILFLGRMVKP